MESQLRYDIEGEYALKGLSNLQKRFKELGNLVYF